VRLADGGTKLTAFVGPAGRIEVSGAGVRLVQRILSARVRADECLAVGERL
jgi:hypothetical protein